MLLGIAIVALILAFACFVLIAFANGMAAAPGVDDASQWPSIVLFAFSIVCFVLHHVLRNVQAHW